MVSFSLNCLDWCLLPPATDDVIRDAQVIKGRFIGDPAHEYELTVRRKAGEGPAVYEEEVTVMAQFSGRSLWRGGLRGGLSCFLFS